jgi:hypothetical protein
MLKIPQEAARGAEGLDKGRAEVEDRARARPRFTTKGKGRLRADRNIQVLKTSENNSILARNKDLAIRLYRERGRSDFA